MTSTTSPKGKRKMPNDCPPPPPRIPCTYPSCNFFFPTEKAMQGHKANSGEHDYCAKCDLDFKNDDQLLIHKIKSDKHIVCPVCSIDFKSEGGRDRHIRQFHRTTQNLTCRGCKDTFRSAAGLMRHIEEGECPVISQDKLLFEQSKKLMRKEALEVSKSPAAPSLVDIDEEADGGVQLPSMSRSEKNRQAMANQPGRSGAANINLMDEHWPTLPGDTGLEDGMANLMDFSTAEVQDKGKHNDKGKENASRSASAGWSDKGREHTASEAGSGTTGTAPASSTTLGASIGPPDAELLQKIYRDWDAKNYFDPFTSEYVCACGKRCTTKANFEKHVLSKSQGSRRMQCPGCLKIFKSTAALMAHWEAPTTKCDVNETNLYAQIVDEVSGGMIQIASGANEDGTIRYEAGKIDLQKKTTVGVDLDKIGW